MGTTLEILHNYFFTGVITLFFFQSIILFVRSKQNIARKTMAITELLWGLEYLMTFILMNLLDVSREYMLMREKVLIVGNCYIVIALFFPMQVLIPGWLNWRRIVLLFLPIVAMTAFFYGGIYFLDESIEHPSTYAALYQSIGHFNIWFRFVMLFSNMIYIYYVLRWVNGFEHKYIQWKNENFSDQEYVDISWMKSYYYILVGIFLFYLGILFIGGRISVMFHCSFCVLSFSYLFYKALFYESPYPKGFHVDGTDNTKDPIVELCAVAVEEKMMDSEDLEGNFDSMLETYTYRITKWMEEEKPYLYKEFKLTDVVRVLPLNRSYLSRVFNEGFGRNFSEVVRAYRVEYAKELIKNNKMMPFYEIAELSGFSSSSTMNRAFKQTIGMTPNQFKLSIE